VAHGFPTALSGSQIKPPALPEVCDSQRDLTKVSLLLPGIRKSAHFINKAKYSSSA